MHCAQKALTHFVSRGGGGCIVNCSSVHQIIPKPGYLAYSISKGGMANLTRTLALEFADRGIRVNAVGAGAVDTPMNAAWTGDEAKRAVVESHIPLGRVATAEEIAGIFAFLASHEASYVPARPSMPAASSRCSVNSARIGRARYKLSGGRSFGLGRERWCRQTSRFAGNRMNTHKNAPLTPAGRCWLSPVRLWLTDEIF